MAIQISHYRSDGTEVYIASQLSGKNIVRGRNRRGIRSGDWEKETSSDRHFLDNPQAEKARVLVETAAVIGADLLTAQDIALHEYLLACARRKGLDKARHKISMKALTGYLGITKPERVWDSLERLMATIVRYHIIDPTTSRRVCLPMLQQVAMSTNRITDKTVIDYAIPGVIRDAILESRAYTWIDINTFPKFRCKYSGRLYPKLALMAGYDHRVRKPWTPTIDELAQFIGYAKPGDAVHAGSFFRMLDKALAEIAEHVTRFEVVCVKPKRAAHGQGRPLAGTFYITTSSTTRSVYSYKPAFLGPSQIGQIEDRRYTLLEDREHPPVKYFAQAQVMTGFPAEELSNRWRRDVIGGRLDPEVRIGAMTGALLTSVLDDEGIRNAFRFWIGMAVMVDPADVIEVPEVTDDTPRYVPGSVAATWIEEEVWYGEDGYTEEDEIEDLKSAGDYDLQYGEKY